MRRLYLIFFFKVPPVGVTAESYMNTIKRLGSFNTLQEFWKYYRVLSDLGFLPKQINLQLFKSGIRPIWEEPYNIKGGKWVCFFMFVVLNSVLQTVSVRGTRENSISVWSRLLAAAVSEQLSFYHEIVSFSHVIDINSFSVALYYL